MEPFRRSGVGERPLYRPREMVSMGPFKVSPMGFGTWAWVRQCVGDGQGKVV